jgi:2-ketocyclohexanecarboxyl-CoA hydrolase
MGLVNAVVPASDLDTEVNRWCQELVARSPTALALAKQSFNADTESIRGIASMGFQALRLFLGTDESREGVAAFKEKRPPRFRKSK